MKHIFLLLLLFTFIYLSGCDTVTDSSNNNNGEDTITGTKLNINTEILDSVVNVSAMGDYYHFLDVKAGYSYNIHLDFNPPNLKGIVSTTLPFEDDIEYGYFFTPKNDGLCSLKIQFYGMQGEINASYSIKVFEYSSIPKNYEGKWLLKKETPEFNGYQTSWYYDVSSAYELIEIKGDSLYRYIWSTSDTNYIKFSSLCSGYKLFKGDVYHNGETLIFQYVNDYGSKKYIYEKFNGDVNDLQWHKSKDVNVPDELVGTWYYSRNYGATGEGFGGCDSITNQDTNSYNSVDESIEIKIITKDSIITYYNKDSGVVDISRISVNLTPWFITESNTKDNKLINRNLFFHYWGADHWRAKDETTEYIKYDGEVPPASWYDVKTQ